MDLPPPPAEPLPIVKPRQVVAGFPRLVVVHLHDDLVYREDGDESTVWDWVLGLEDEPPALVACQYVGRLLELCHLRWQDHRRWQWKVTPTEDPLPDGENNTIIRTLVSFFGFAGKVEGAKHRANRYFHCLDPLQFGRTNLSELGRPGEAEIVTVYRWASEVRDFCMEQGLKPSTTRGGLAKQLLRDPRFYPSPRRKVPKATNDRLREQLPGNHYELKGEPHRLYAGVYLDQVSSHHTIAADTPLPASDQLYARGYFHSMMDRPWAKPGSRRFAQVTGELGVLYVKLRVPDRGDLDWRPPWAEPISTPSTAAARERYSEEDLALMERKERLAWVYTNELRLLPLYGVQILYVIAAWTTPTVDDGIRRYAVWAKDYLREAPALTRSWLKPTLLTLYGMLATRPRAPIAGWWRAEGGRPTMLPIGRELIPTQIKEAGSEGEPSTNHVLQRGMIEAEMRARSLELARELEAGGYNVLCIYADAVMVETTHTTGLPLMADYWRPKGSLNLLRFLDETHFTSREMVRLPGVRRDSPVRAAPGTIRRRDAVQSRTTGVNRRERSNGHVEPRPGEALV